jgi:hypothetical protein
MLPGWHFLVLYALFYLRRTAALPQGTTTSEVASVAAPQPTAGNSSVAEERRCDFDSINDFFSYATENGLNITVEVQNCQNLCLLTYGVGNPDLSGIGVSHLLFSL